MLNFNNFYKMQSQFKNFNWISVTRFEELMHHAILARSKVQERQKLEI